MTVLYDVKQLWLKCARILIIVAAAHGSLSAREASKADRPANEAAKSVHDEAVRILKSIKLTEYRHKTDIDEQNGAYYCDCSGFVGYVLNRTVAKEDGKGPFGDGKTRPLAMDYERGFAAAPETARRGERWQKIVRLIDTRPGDVIAWRREVPKPGNTGHVVIVDQAPVVEKNGLLRVVMIDSTTGPQVDDTRAKGTSGIGRGTMWFVVDKDGRPIGHVRGSRDAKPKTEPISIGRLIVRQRRISDRPQHPKNELVRLSGDSRGTR